MKASKNPRQNRILHIVRTQNISTQEELVDALKKEGLEVTQATVSRDIKELGIIKVATASGEQKYIPMNKSGEGASGRLMKVFTEAITSLELASNFVVAKTLPGMAQAAAAALDSMHLEELLASLAGDDTIFIATADERSAESVCQELRKLANLELDYDDYDSDIDR